MIYIENEGHIIIFMISPEDQILRGAAAVYIYESSKCVTQYNTQRSSVT